MSLLRQSLEKVVLSHPRSETKADRMFDKSPVKILKLKSSVFSDFVGLKTAIVGRGENFFLPVSG